MFTFIFVYNGMRESHPNSPDTEILKFTVGWIIVALLFICFFGTIIYIMLYISNQTINNNLYSSNASIS